MPMLECAGKTVELDENGFLVKLEEWDEDVARSLAAAAGVDGLNEEQLEIITFMRNYYLKFKAFPLLGQVCKIVHQRGKCVNEQFINPEKAWKIAGLPKLDGIHFITLDGENYTMEECC